MNKGPSRTALKRCGTGLVYPAGSLILSFKVEK